MKRRQFFRRSNNILIESESCREKKRQRKNVFHVIWNQMNFQNDFNFFLPALLFLTFITFPGNNLFRIHFCGYNFISNHQSDTIFNTRWEKKIFFDFSLITFSNWHWYCLPIDRIISWQQGICLFLHDFYHLTITFWAFICCQ